MAKLEHVTGEESKRPAEIGPAVSVVLVLIVCQSGAYFVSQQTLSKSEVQAVASSKPILGS